MSFITDFFLNIEEKARKAFERVPFLQAFIAGIGVIIFWRGVWEFLDASGVSPVASIILGILLLGSVGVFIQTFIGNTIIIRNAKKEEKVEKRVLEKIKGEEDTEVITLALLSRKIDAITDKLEGRG
jgi:hypothetical protein